LDSDATILSNPAQPCQTAAAVSPASRRLFGVYTSPENLPDDEAMSRKELAAHDDAAARISRSLSSVQAVSAFSRLFLPFASKV